MKSNLLQLKKNHFLKSQIGTEWYFCFLFKSMTIEQFVKSKRVINFNRNETQSFGQIVFDSKWFDAIDWLRFLSSVQLILHQANQFCLFSRLKCCMLYYNGFLSVANNTITFWISDNDYWTWFVTYRSYVNIRIYKVTLAIYLF